MDAMDVWAERFVDWLKPRQAHWEFCHEVDDHATAWTVFSKGRRTSPVPGVVKLYHGTTLDILYDILRQGFRGGYGHHMHNRRTRNGVFAIEAPDGYTWHARRLALDRATVSRSRKLALWRDDKSWPTMGSTPVVLAIHKPRDECTFFNPHSRDAAAAQGLHRDEAR